MILQNLKRRGGSHRLSMQSELDVVTVSLIGVRDHLQKVLRLKVPDRAGCLLILPMVPAVIDDTVISKFTEGRDIFHRSVAVRCIAMGQDHIFPALRISLHQFAVKQIVIHSQHRIGTSFYCVEILPQSLFDLPVSFLCQRFSLRLGDLVCQIHAAAAGRYCRRGDSSEHHGCCRFADRTHMPRLPVNKVPVGTPCMISCRASGLFPLQIVTSIPCLVASSAA